jgi:hypothetical protein
MHQGSSQSAYHQTAQLAEIVISLLADARPDILRYAHANKRDRAAKPARRSECRGQEASDVYSL